MELDENELLDMWLEMTPPLRERMVPVFRELQELRRIRTIATNLVRRPDWDARAGTNPAALILVEHIAHG